MVQNFVTKTDLLLPKTLNFIEDGNISTQSNSLDIIKSPVPTQSGRRPAKVMVSGFHQDVDSIIKQLHKLHVDSIIKQLHKLQFAEYNDWTVAVSLGNGEILKLLMRYFS